MSQDTREQILDTAERLFADQGIGAVSLRAITAEAGVNLAAIHYHFGSKEALVIAVFDRRIVKLNEERLALLDEAEERAGDGAAPLEELLRALFEPAIRFSQDPRRGQTLVSLCGRLYAEPAGFVQKYFEERFGPVIERFTAAFAQALPELSEKERGWRLHFAAGAMVFTMLEKEKLKRFSKGLCDPANVDETLDHMVRFAAAGLRAPSLGPSARTKGSSGSKPQEVTA